MTSLPVCEQIQIMSERRKQDEKSHHLYKIEDVFSQSATFNILQRHLADDVVVISRSHH